MGSYFRIKRERGGVEERVEKEDRGVLWYVIYRFDIERLEMMDI